MLLSHTTIASSTAARLCASWCASRNSSKIRRHCCWKASAGTSILRASVYESNGIVCHLEGAMQHTKGTLSGYKRLQLVYGAWLPAGGQKAVAVLVHGISEHMGRYTHVIAALVQHDYAVYAVDHRG